LADRRRGKTRFAALAKLSDADIRRAVANDPDSAPVAGADWFAKARVGNRPAKKAISIKLDEDVLAFFRSQGVGYQTRINAVLRAYMEHAKS
jgi:uncharacterized protein (DUF4415 family)